MSANVKDIQSASEFEQLTNSGVALVDFYATWCGPCRALGPVLHEVADEVGDAGAVLKVNVDSAPELAQRYNVQSIPHIVVLRDGQVVDQYIGLQDKSTLSSAIRNANSATV